MLTPDQVSGLQILFERLTDPVSEYLIRDIARRVQEAGQMTSTAAYQAYKLQTLGKTMAEIQEQIALLLSVSADQAAEIIQAAAEYGYNLDADRLGSAVAFADNVHAQQITAAAVKLARKDLTNITQTIGFAVGKRGESLTSAYERAMDFAFMQVSTGAADYNTAIRRACAGLVRDGIQQIDYESGRYATLEVAARRNLMSTMGNAVNEITKRNHDDMGADGWEIDAHKNSAPDHEPIQGKQYSDAEFERLNRSLVRPIGTLNCGHNASPIIMGVHEPLYTAAELRKMRSDNAKGVKYEGREFASMYEATQYQRRIERAIRAQKRRMWTATPDKEQDEKIRLRALQSEYRRFSSAVNLRTEEERLYARGVPRIKKKK